MNIDKYSIDEEYENFLKIKNEIKKGLELFLKIYN